MFKPIPGNNEFLISITQEVRGLSGQSVKNFAPNGKLEISLYGKKDLYDLLWLAAVAHYELFLPDPSFKRLSKVEFFDNNIKFFRPLYGKLPVFKSPIEIVHDKTIFRVIPAYCRYAVSCDGKILELENKKLLEIQLAKRRAGHEVDSYPSVFIYNPDKAMYKYVYVHRLVAMAWVNNPANDFVERPIVNHIDGNKKNYHFRNLEWCSFLENNVHAVNTGLRGDNFPCKVRDFKTGEVRKFASLSQAEQFMGLVSKTIRTNNFHKCQSKLIGGRYEFKLQTDETPWFYENRTEKAKTGRYFITVTYSDGKIEYFHDTRDFKLKFKIWNIGNVSQMVAKVRMMRPELKIDITDFYHSEKVQAYNLETKDISVYDTIVQTSKETGVSEDRIRYALNAGEQFSYSGYAFRYEKDIPWVTEFIKRGVSRGKSMKAVNESTGEEMIFEGIRAAYRFLKVDRQWIRYCLIHGVTLKGWKLTSLGDEHN